MGCPAVSRRRRNFHVGVQKSLRGGSSCSSVTTKVPGLVGVSTGAATCSRSCEALFFWGCRALCTRAWCGDGACSSRTWVVVELEVSNAESGDEHVWLCLISSARNRLPPGAGSAMACLAKVQVPA